MQQSRRPKKKLVTTINSGSTNTFTGFPVAVLTLICYDITHCCRSRSIHPDDYIRLYQSGEKNKELDELVAENRKHLTHISLKLIL